MRTLLALRPNHMIRLLWRYQWALVLLLALFSSRTARALPNGVTTTWIGGRTTTVGCNAALPNCHGNAGSPATGVTMSANGGAAQALANTPTFTVTPNVMATFAVNFVNSTLTGAFVRGGGLVVFHNDASASDANGLLGAGAGSHSCNNV